MELILIAVIGIIFLGIMVYIGGEIANISAYLKIIVSYLKEFKETK